jgi:hypothetical protein
VELRLKKKAHLRLFRLFYGSLRLFVGSLQASGQWFRLF